MEASNKSDNEVLQEINAILANILKELLLPPQNNYKESKVIHDPLWGSCLFYPWEVCLIDTLLLQRLRGIHQLGTAFLTYPSGIHTRFSHTLGVTFLADKLINKLKESLTLKSNVDIEITQKDIYTVRLAGLLHDIGHCFFSHASEKFLEKQLTEYGINLKELLNTKAKLHEILSFLIIRHPLFEEFYNTYVVPLFPRSKEAPQLEDISNIIIGKNPSNEKAFLKEIISGPYDVDKLEYLYRDAKTAGLEISYDIERFFYKIALFRDKYDKVRLVMTLGGIQAVEQIIFNKMMLFSFVYHHHKVLAADALFFDLMKGLFEIDDATFPMQIKHPFDCLKYNDHDILAPSVVTNNDSYFNTIKQMLLNRNLPKKCFVINREFVEGIDTDSDVREQYVRFQKDVRNNYETFRKELMDYLNCKQNEIFVVFPDPPTMGEITTAPVLNSKNELESITLYFQLDGWENSYELKKLRGYFFVPEELKENTASKIENFLKEKYNLSFKPQSKIEAKVF